MPGEGLDAAEALDPQMEDGRRARSRCARVDGFATAWGIMFFLWSVCGVVRDYLARELALRNGVDLLSRFLASQIQLVGLLQVHPEVGGRAEVPRQAQGRVCGDRALSGKELGNPVRRNVQAPRQIGG